jgi:site-specific recombinase XerC
LHGDGLNCKKQQAKLNAWRRDHRFSPNQLRHNAATAIRKQFGIEAARTVLGHGSAAVTEIYAAMDLARASEVMARIG